MPPRSDPYGAKQRQTEEKDVASVYSNGEKQYRPWLAYSKTLDKIFCFCCKFMNRDKNASHLASKGYYDWNNISETLKKHETSHEHIYCLSQWMEFESNKHVQEQEHESLHRNWLSLERTLKKKKYGLQLSAPKSSIRNTAPIFGEEDEDNNVEKDISRQASKTKKLKEIEEKNKKALEENPSAFAYDEVYDDLKHKALVPRMQDREERKPRYIQQLMEQAERRKKEQEIVYERKLAKERAEEEHIFGDKAKYISGAYKKKLEERNKWLEEERLRELREEKEDVTKKKDLSDFYYTIGKKLAFGARNIEAKEAEKKMEKLSKEEIRREEKKIDSKEKEAEKEAYEKKKMGVSLATEEKQSSIKEAAKEAPKGRKRSEDAIAAAKERFLARKKAKIED